MSKHNCTTGRDPNVFHLGQGWMLRRPKPHWLPGYRPPWMVVGPRRCWEMLARNLAAPVRFGDKPDEWVMPGCLAWHYTKNVG